MTNQPRLRIATAVACFLGLLLVASDAAAQTTTSNRDWDPDTTKGQTKVNFAIDFFISAFACRGANHCA